MEELAIYWRAWDFLTSLTSNWAMPHKIFKLYTKLKHIETLQMHRFIQNNNKNTHATHRGKTHKNKRISNNATCNLTHN